MNIGNRVIFASILAVVFSAVAAAQSLEGTVRDSRGTAIPDAAVALWRGENVVQQATTNESGKFRFKGVDVGEYTMKVEASGAYPAEYKVMIGRGHPVKRDIVLKSTTGQK